jgi:magnesium-transporting ATPase (P-type)
MENSTSETITAGEPLFLWMAEPVQRGTFGILSFCFSTLIIYVWSALHFDILATHHTFTRQFFIHASWVVTALVAPEVLLCVTINQMIGAGKLVKKAVKYLSSQELAKPGMLAKSEDVSTQHQASTI